MDESSLNSRGEIGNHGEALLFVRGFNKYSNNNLEELLSFDRVFVFRYFGEVDIVGQYTFLEFGLEK